MDYINHKMMRKLVRNILDKLGLLQYFFDIYTWYQNNRTIIVNGYNKKDYNYISLYDTDADLQTKMFHAKEIARLLHPNKILIAGCSKGNAVKAFHEIGIDAWGFDIFALEDKNNLKKYIKQGSLLSIPFSDKDNFDLFLCTDVFEHIYMRDIPLMVDEIYRLKIEWMAVIIGQGLCDGHVTLKSLKWWDKQFKGKYRRCPEIKTALRPGVYGLDPSTAKAYFTFWKIIDYKTIST